MMAEDRLANQWQRAWETNWQEVLREGKEEESTGCKPSEEGIDDKLTLYFLINKIKIKN